MELGNVTTDPTKDYGITFVREQHNSSLPPVIINGEGELVPNPDLMPSDYAYLLARIGSMVDSWARQADLAVAPPPPPPPGVINGVPQVVTKRQGRQALALAGKLDDVQNAINALPEPQRTLMQIEWDDSTEFHRQRPSLIQLGTAIGLTSEDIDNLFIQAASL